MRVIKIQKDNRREEHQSNPQHNIGESGHRQENWKINGSGLMKHLTHADE